MNAAAEPKPAPAAGAADLWSTGFRREREASWRDLERIVQKAESLGLKRLSPEDLLRLPALYRATVSSLSVARAISLDRNLLDWLEALAARAYLCVYAPRSHFREAVGTFLLAAFPRAVRRHLGAILLAAGFLLLGMAAGLVLTLRDPDLFWSFVAEEMAQGRDPAASTEYLRGTLYHEVGEGGSLGVFASYLFTHNARIGILCFALGFAAGIPVLLLLLTNGFTLGAMAAVFHSRGLGLDFWGWILPHGITELLAVVLCGAAGLEVGRCLLFPGPHSRLDNLVLRGRDAGVLVAGTIFLFLVAGLVEGIFRQTVQSVGVRYAVAAASAAAWLLFFRFAGRRGRP